MGQKTPVTQEYQYFLNLAKANHSARKDKNFFHYQYVNVLKRALMAEIQNSKKILQDFKDVEVSNFDDVGGLLKFLENLANKLDGQFKKIIVAIITKLRDVDPNVDPYKVQLEAVKKLRKELKGAGKEQTPFLTFAEKAIDAINRYLDETESVTATNYDVSTVARSMYNFKKDLSDALKEYRHTAKSHHYFKLSTGRAVIADKSGSTERWLNNSYKALDTVGTKFPINPNVCYLCRKSTDEEDKKEPENEGRPKFLRNSKIIMDIVPK